MGGLVRSGLVEVPGHSEEGAAGGVEGGAGEGSSGVASSSSSSAAANATASGRERERPKHPNNPTNDPWNNVFATLPGTHHHRHRYNPHLHDMYIHRRRLAKMGDASSASASADGAKKLRRINGRNVY